MQDALQPIKDLMELLKLEKQEDFEQFKNFVQGLSLSEKREKGFTWFPVQSIKSGYTIGDRAFVVIEYANLGKEQNHLFRSGKVVNLFTQQAGAYQPEKTGVINYVNKNKMKIVLNSKDLPDWLNDGQIGVDLMFDERTYLEMEKALKKVLTASNDRLAELRRVILGQQAASSIPIKTIPSIQNLNPSQNKAILQINSNNDITIVHGPPGTGKTTTLVQAVKLLAKTEAVILVTAPSNAAVDLLTEKIAAEDLEVIRIGNISRVDDSIINHTLEMNLANHPESKNIKKVKIQAAKARKKARKFKRKFGSKEYNERKSLFQEAKDLAAWARQLEDRLVDQILSNAKVITATLVGSSHKILDQLKFRTVFIDEAAQALEPASWIPILRASRVVLIGDPFQ
ncbi:MAG TPA: AAA family ATPase, partial [Saprospiraceae bacterium]|nr:AAA family ATPase [Saprospiraceae bacterium]